MAPHSLWCLNGRWVCSSCGRKASGSKAQGVLARTACLGSAAARLLGWTLGDVARATTVKERRRRLLLDQGAVLLPLQRAGPRVPRAEGSTAQVATAAPHRAQQPQQHRQAQGAAAAYDTADDAMLEDQLGVPFLDGIPEAMDDGNRHLPEEDDPSGFAELDLDNNPASQRHLRRRSLSPAREMGADKRRKVIESGPRASEEQSACLASSAALLLDRRTAVDEDSAHVGMQVHIDQDDSEDYALSAWSLQRCGFA